MTPSVPRKYRILGVGAVVLLAILLRCIGWNAIRNQPSSSIRDELKGADDLAWTNQWAKASRVYRDVELRSAQLHDLPDALYARDSQMILQAESLPVQPLLKQLEQDLLRPEARLPDVHLRLLTIEGMLATNFNAALAKPIWEDVEREASQQHQYRLMMRAIGEQGIAAYLLGDAGRAKKLITRAWFAAKYLGDPAAQVRYASVYGTGLVELQRYDEALRVLDEAIATANKHSELAFPSIAYIAKIDALRGLHLYNEASSLADECIARLPAQHLDTHLFEIRLERGRIFEDQGHLDPAVQQYTEALSYARRISYWRGVSKAARLLSLCLLHMGSAPAALVSIDEAIDANGHLPQEIYDLPENLAVKAQTLETLKRPHEAGLLYRRSLRIADILLRTAPTPNVKREMLGEFRLVYVGYFEALTNAGRYSEAFEVIESARGRIQAEALEHQDRDSLEPEPAERKLSGINRMLIQTSDTAMRQALDQQIYEAETALSMNAEPRILTHSPAHLIDVRSKLQPDELILEYVFDDPLSYVIAINATSSQVYRIKGHDVLGKEIDQYRYELLHKTENRRAALSLYNALFAPIHEIATSKKIIVIPDQELNLLPLATLFDGRAYMLETKDISVVPSATVLCLLRTPQPAAFNNSRLLGVAPWTEEDEWAIPPTRLGAYPPAPVMTLPATRQEVMSVASSVNEASTLLIGPDATETRFKRLDLASFDILHLALHAYADIQYPDRSALIFAPEPDGPDDGLLTVREIRHLSLHSRLVTLSACDTGKGPVGEADVASLANAFIEAGSRSVVAALWRADDNATAELMQAFYRGTAQGQPLTTALRRAELQLLSRGAAPYYWAPFQITGDGATLLNSR